MDTPLRAHAQVCRRCRLRPAKSRWQRKRLCLVAERFQIWDGTSAFAPFEIIAGKVLIKEALIEKISAGKLTSGDIEAQQIRLVGRAATIGSDNYSAGESGWIVRGDGSAEFNKITVRDTIVIGTLGSVSLAPPCKDFKEGASVAVRVSAPANSTVRYTTDSNSVTPTSSEWPKSGGVYGTLTITTMTWLKVRAFGIDGRLSSEVMGLYIPTGTTMESVAVPAFAVDGPTLAITCATGGAMIKYRTKPTSGATWSGWSNYAIPLTFSESTDVEAYATKSGMVDSAITQTTIVPKCSTPGFSTPQRYNGTGYFYVTISCSTSGATIYYRETTSSSPGAPWGAWKIYTTGSQITNSMPSSTNYNKPVQAYATKSGLGDSDIASASIPPG